MNLLKADLKCTLEDIEYGAQIYAYYTVNENGEPDRLDIDDIREATAESDEFYWHCKGCGEDFHDWNEVKGHLT